MTGKETLNTKGLTIRRDGRLHSEDLAHDSIPDIESYVRKNSSDYSKPALIKKLSSIQTKFNKSLNTTISVLTILFMLQQKSHEINFVLQTQKNQRKS